MATTTRKNLPVLVRGQSDAQIDINVIGDASDAGLPYVVAAVLTIDAKTTGATTLYTVPLGKYFVPHLTRIRPITLVAPGGTPSISVGANASTYDDLVTDSAMDLDAMTSVAMYSHLSVDGVRTVYGPGEVIKAKVNTGGERDDVHGGSGTDWGSRLAG
jgi:hypothetical protein